MGALSWLFGGNDHELAETQYEGRESASDRAARRERAPRSSTFGRPSRNNREAAREGQEWEDDLWRHIPKTAWFRGKG